ncbi:hypothetical protein Tco_1444877 [Tanacetum coccineum]
MDIRQFLCLLGYNQRFIKGFSKIAMSMTKLTQKGVKFDWGDKQEAAFQLLKQKLCVRQLWLYLREAEISPAISLSPASSPGRGYSKNGIPNSVWSLRVPSYAIWLDELTSDHWLELLNDYDCEIRYHLGKANVVADALSRKERSKPLRVRALVMTIGLDLPKQILNAQTEARKPENIKNKDVRGVGCHVMET